MKLHHGKVAGSTIPIDKFITMKTSDLVTSSDH